MRALLVLLAGCSFIGVHGPGALPDPLPPAEQIHCTTDDLLPSVDALGGAAALAAAVGGVIIEHTSASGEPRDFTKYYMTPLIVVGIVYFVAASHGTDKVETCQAAKDRSPIPVQE
ncbi:MAG: hypothetical protein JO257_11460 [Deltaproteobacteria bacterium]|nr:hypothetical protein [Deltaproteobacteria bacterium]